MARKKKSEPTPPPEEEVVNVPDEELEVASFIPFENGIPDGPTSASTLTINCKDVPTSSTVVSDTSKDECIPFPALSKPRDDYVEKIAHAFEVIEKCNLYMWAGLDWGTGRIYEMSRKEWANYVIAMYEWSDNGFTGVEPVMPSEVKYE